MNKKILIIMLCAIIGIVLYVNLSGDNSEPEEVSEDVKLLTESYKTEFIIYGSELKFDNGCYARHIEEITKENLTSDPEYVYKVLVINNMDETVTFTEDMVNIIKEEMNNNRLSVYYTGVDSTPYVQSGIESGFSLGGRKDYILMGRVHEFSKATKPTAFLCYWEDFIYEDYKKGNHKYLVDLIISETVPNVKSFFGN